MKFTEELKERSLKLLKAGYNNTEVCRDIDISLELFYTERKRDIQFKEKIEKAKMEFKERSDKECRR
ncbi:MAG TPA: hypothetical protein PKJ95_03945 [Atribacterota bacterium]|nr:hypothetical protein [Atribacterota bacterium]